MAKSKTEVNFMEHLKPLLPAGGDASGAGGCAQALGGPFPRKTANLRPLSRSLPSD